VERDDEAMRERLFQAFEMWEFGVEIMAANLRRRYPDASVEQIEHMVDDWLATRPGAEAGDGDGVPADLSKWR
jgi:hypothetical protein